MDFEGAFFNTDDFKLHTTKLGKGTFGTVYVSENIKDGTQYATKIFDCDKGFNGHQQMLLLRESLILHKLNHPSIVKFKGVNFQSFSDPTKLEPSIITEYLPHGSLKDNLDKEKRCIADHQWSNTKKYITLLGISDAMRYLHEKGIIHRDLKPMNVLMDENYYPRICDFGFSRCFSSSLEKSVELTMTGQIGTPLYMAPELLRGDTNYSQSVDVYAFGILAYEIVSGKDPYNELGEILPIALANKVISGYRPQLNDNISSKMKELLTRCWNDDPHERPLFSEIFDLLSSDFSYFVESVDEDEIQEFLDILSESKNESKKVSQHEKEIEKLQQELNQLKQKIAFQQQELDQDSIDELIQALHCLLGNKIEHNTKLAIFHLEQSSKKGNSYASYILGLIYENNENAELDLSMSIPYYFKSSEQGNSHGLNRIGFCYKNGFGVQKDYLIAIEYYEKAAKLGNSFALNNLGSCYYNGKGVKKDYSKAIEYFKKSADLGNNHALNNLGTCYLEGKGVEKDYAKAFEYYQKSADLGNNDAINNLGYCYYTGKGVEIDYSRAIKYYKESAHNGNSEAIFNLSTCYFSGNGVKLDHSIGLEYLQKSADLGNLNGIRNLGNCYYNGNFVFKDESKAIEYFQKGADLGSADMMNNIGFIYFKKQHGLIKDYSKSIEYFLKAVRLGDKNGMYNLSYCYKHGFGVKKDQSESSDYYEKASKIGQPDLQFNLYNR